MPKAQLEFIANTTQGWGSDGYRHAKSLWVHPDDPTCLGPDHYFTMTDFGLMSTFFWSPTEKYVSM